uniref:microtubule-associated tumor suppressor 1 homolog n=1 Tax=Fragaria vesca subsp. vesca TaxID=101020 RepID=UPI0005CB0733|nr:PREDICTED: microtubule-associated tumor suppressor 1 homolog [Fragaria vesca subsp. vesca]
MDRIRQLNRRPSPTTGGSSPPKKRPCATPNDADFADLVDRNEANAREVSREEYDQALKERDLALDELKNLRAELKEVENYRSSASAEFELGKKEWEAEKKALNERLDREFNNFASELKDVLKKLCDREDELEKTSQELDSYRNSLELGKKEWEAEKKALNERLDKGFNNFGAQLKEVMKSLSKSEAELQKTSQERDSYRNSLELGKKEWEDEKIAMTQKLDHKINTFGAELKEVPKNLSKCDDNRNSLELGNKVWEAARIKMAKRISMAFNEKETALELGKNVAAAKKIEMANKEKNKGNCPRSEAPKASYASNAMVSKEKKNANWPTWGALETSYASNPLQDLQIGQRG